MLKKAGLALFHNASSSACDRAFDCTTLSLELPALSVGMPSDLQVYNLGGTRDEFHVNAETRNVESTKRRK